MLTIRFNQAWEDSSSKNAKKHGCEQTYRHFEIMSAIIFITFENYPECYKRIRWISIGVCKMKFRKVCELYLF